MSISKLKYLGQEFKIKPYKIYFFVEIYLRVLFVFLSFVCFEIESHSVAQAGLKIAVFQARCLRLPCPCDDAEQLLMSVPLCFT